MSRHEGWDSSEDSEEEEILNGRLLIKKLALLISPLNPKPCPFKKLFE
jgi:hypothetical protein